MSGRVEPRKAHICFFPGQLQLGGVGRNTINLAKELSARGTRVDFFLSKRAGAYLPKVPSDVRITEAGGSVRASIPHLIRYLRRETPDLLVSARPYINLAALIARDMAGVRTRVVVTERTSGVTENRVYGGLRRRMISIGCRVLYPRADHVVAVSEAVARDLVEITGMDRQRIKVIYNPVVTRDIEERAREKVRDPWFERDSGPIVMGVGRLSAQKDFPTLIQAFARVRKDIHGRLVILGEGEEREALESLVRDLGMESSVYLPGYVENPFAYLARADVFVLSSRWEGLPTALIEALAVGAPVISTDCPGGSREILCDGKFGELLPVGDVGSMARAIRTVLSRPVSPERLIQRAAHFSVGRAADRYLELIDP